MSRDGSAGDVDYARFGVGYTGHRQADPRIAAAVRAALGDARSVLNVGAGAGSYEPIDLRVIALEPSATMRDQRPAHLTRAIPATAEHLPFADASFDAAMATFTVHQWADLDSGLAELRRVTRGPIAILTCDPTRVRDFWLAAYAPEVLDVEASRYPAIERLRARLGGASAAHAVPIPRDCLDGFNEAYFGRPERLLDPAARRACSAWSFVSGAAVTHFERTLRNDLDAGRWDKRHGALRTAEVYEGSLVLVTTGAPARIERAG